MLPLSEQLIYYIMSSRFCQALFSIFFFDSFKCQTFRSSMMENRVFGFVEPFLRFPPLPSRGQLIYITTPVPVCQHLFSTFFVFFFFGETEPPLYVKEREPKAPARRVHRGLPLATPFFNFVPPPHKDPDSPAAAGQNSWSSSRSRFSCAGGRPHTPCRRSSPR